MATTTIGPISTERINNVLTVGANALPTIQSGVNYARAEGGSFIVTIPFGYAGGDTIAGVVNGNAAILLSDRRGNNTQTYIWNGAMYIPADFVWLSDEDLYGRLTVWSADRTSSAFFDAVSVPAHARIISFDHADTKVVGGFEMVGFSSDSSRQIQWMNCVDDGTNPVIYFADSDVTMERNATVEGTLTANIGEFQTCDVEGTLTADDGEFQTCEVDGSPVVTFANIPPTAPTPYPPVGVGVSTGSAWAISIDPATLPRLDAQNTFSFPAAAGAATTFLAPNMPSGQQYTLAVGRNTAVDGFVFLEYRYSSAGSVGALGFAGKPAVATFDQQGNWNFLGAAIDADGDAHFADTYTNNVYINGTAIQSDSRNLLLNWSQGGSVQFGNGANGSVASVDNAGNASFNGTVAATGAGLLVFNNAPLVANRAALSFSNNTTYLDAVGADAATGGTFNLRSLSADASHNVSTLIIDAAGNVLASGNVSSQGRQLPVGTDCNTVTVPGCYSIQGGLNAPGGYGYLMLVVDQSSPVFPGFVVQTGYPLDYGTAPVGMWSRMNRGNGWSAWHQIY